jgi:tRNA nucleotidyltransferase/poly(A) polymerase
MPKIYKVGGCVRDELLGVDPKDIDYTFVLDNLHQTVEQGFAEMETFLKDNGYQIFLSTPEMFTIRAKFPKDSQRANTVADFVMARREVGYIPGTRRPVLALGTLQDDLERRDFTVNAMAFNSRGILVDPFGGEADLSFQGKGILKTPMPANKTLMEDPLRILRALRFNITKGFIISDEIWEAMGQAEILQKLEQTVSGERIREEVFKMMKFDTVESLKLFQRVEEMIPGFLKLVFGKNMWLKPTFEQ